MRKVVLSLHLLASVGWIGVCLAYVVLGLAVRRSDDATFVVTAWDVMELLVRWVLVPLAVAAFCSGVALALVTRWGLLRHYWVIFALIGTAVAALVLIDHVGYVSGTAANVQTMADAGAGAAELVDHYGADLFHSSLGLGLLVLIFLLNVYKPRGVTRRGWRQRQAAAAKSSP